MAINCYKRLYNWLEFVQMARAKRLRRSGAVRLSRPRAVRLSRYEHQNDAKTVTYRVFSQRVFKTSKNGINPMENAVSKNAKKCCKKPYKTCRL